MQMLFGWYHMDKSRIYIHNISSNHSVVWICIQKAWMGNILASHFTAGLHPCEQEFLSLFFIVIKQTNKMISVIFVLCALTFHLFPILRWCYFGYQPVVYFFLLHMKLLQKNCWLVDFLTSRKKIETWIEKSQHVIDFSQSTIRSSELSKEATKTKITRDDNVKYL